MKRSAPPVLSALCGSLAAGVSTGGQLGVPSQCPTKSVPAATLRAARGRRGHVDHGP